MNNSIVVSPKCTSKSAKYLAEQLGLEYVNPYTTGKTDFGNYGSVINWGCSTPIFCDKIFNHFTSVLNAVDKVATLKLLKDTPNIIPWTKDIKVAEQWLKEGETVVGRELQASSKSKGITMITESKDLYQKKYKFYTKYLDHIGEFRINVFKGKIVSMLEKTQVGDEFKFKLIRGEPIDELQALCKTVDEKLGLDFYGIDVVFDENNNPILLEVNSAPMLFGFTGTKFIELFKKEI
jgi:glutathione synthase/RimK-type ligase-like ATP-grasp enzyme